MHLKKRCVTVSVMWYQDIKVSECLFYSAQVQGRARLGLRACLRVKGFFLLQRLFLAWATSWSGVRPFGHVTLSKASHPTVTVNRGPFFCACANQNIPRGLMARPRPEITLNTLRWFLVCGWCQGKGRALNLWQLETWNKRPDSSNGCALIWKGETEWITCRADRGHVKLRHLVDLSAGLSVNWQAV